MKGFLHQTYWPQFFLINANIFAQLSDMLTMNEAEVFIYQSTTETRQNDQQNDTKCQKHLFTYIS